MIRQYTKINGIMKDLGKNILAKAYAVEFLNVLDIAVKQICTGCQWNSLSQLDHYVCLGTIPERLFYASELLPGLVDETKVTYLLESFLIELGIPLTSVPEEIFHVETRMMYFETDPDFMDVIASYAVPWAEPPPPAYSAPSSSPVTPFQAVGIDEPDCEDVHDEPAPKRFKQDGGNHSKD